MSYDPYSKNLKCKWCRRKISDVQIDLQCDRCWEFIARLDYALGIPSIFKWVKGKVEDRIDAIQKEENKK